MHRLFLGFGFVLGALAVAAGAFGAHALADRLAPIRLATFETAARYQMYHALALVLLGLVAARWPGLGWNGPGILLLGGTFVFSGSLYALALTDARWLGAITPLGGVMWIAAWLWAAWLAFSRT
jgi:uncharacterized membrane protein YgdD (TMEM256/DUF423 family)